jgi:WD40 repeat protein
MENMNRVVGVSAVLFLAACGEVPVPTSSSDYTVYEAASTPHSAHLAVIDSRTRILERSLPLGTPSADWRHLYWMSSDRLIDSDPITGATLNTLQTGYYQLPPATLSGVPGGLSQNGKWLVLEAWDHTPNGSPNVTHMLVVSTSFRDAPARIDLTGVFEFDAVSNDGQRVYLIEYMGGNGYRVRIYDVLEQQLDPQVVVDKSDGNDTMAGVRLMGVQSSDGQWQYSVYARQNDGAFIHALNLNGAVSACIFLPGSGYNANPDELRWSLALSPDRNELYASNGAMGVVAEVNVGPNDWPSLARTEHIATGPATASLLAQDVQAKEIDGNASVISPDGKTLVTAGSHGIVWVDTASLVAHRNALSDWRISSLGLSPDGQDLFALNDAGQIADVSMASGAVASRFDPGAGYPMALIRVSAPNL